MISRLSHLTRLVAAPAHANWLSYSEPESSVILRRGADDLEPLQIADRQSRLDLIAAMHESGNGPSRHFAATQHSVAFGAKPTLGRI
jgi:hypothetical protein